MLFNVSRNQGSKQYSLRNPQTLYPGCTDSVPKIDFEGFCWLDLSLFTVARCPAMPVSRIFHIIAFPRLRTAKIDRFLVCYVHLFLTDAGFGWVDLMFSARLLAPARSFVSCVAPRFFYLTCRLHSTTHPISIYRVRHDRLSSI
jgi:hypothetical protein